jgi:hypothetical protein
VSGDSNPFLLPGARPGVPRTADPDRAERADPPPDPPADPPPYPPVVPASPSPEVPSITLPDGTVIPLDQPLLLGRDPAAPEGVHGARAIAIRDPQQTVSKTHALVTATQDGVRVRDLHATNGTAFLLPGGRVTVPAGGELLVTQPGRIELGRLLVQVTC